MGLVLLMCFSLAFFVAALVEELYKYGVLPRFLTSYLFFSSFSTLQMSDQAASMCSLIVPRVLSPLFL
jgi:hypothetical protein